MCNALIHPTIFATVRKQRKCLCLSCRPGNEVETKGTMHHRPATRRTVAIGHRLDKSGSGTFTGRLNRIYTTTNKFLRMHSLFLKLTLAQSGNRYLSFLALGAVCGLFIGCGGPAPPSTKVDTSAKAKENVADECRQKLNSVIGRMKPESMATQTRRDSIASALNAWMSSCVSAEDRNLNLSDANASLLSTSVQRAAGQGRFTESDVSYIRDCLLLSRLTETIWKQTDERNGGEVSPDLARVQQLFQHIIRNVSPLKADENRPPVGLYEVMLTGRGSVNDRIWLFSEALRQRQIDSVLLTAASPGDPVASSIADAADLLLLVVADEQTFLFDPIRGTAVPKADASDIVVTEPADISLIANAERWKAATPYIVANPSSFAPRMFVLQQRMEAQDAATLYEELAGGTSEIQPLVARLNAAVGDTWPTESFKVWDVPEQRLAAAGSLSEQQREEYTVLMRPLDSPFERDSINVGDALVDPSINQEELTPEQRVQLRVMALEERWSRVGASSDELFGKPSRHLLQKRVQQISGAADVDMIQDLQQIRQACMQTLIEVEVPIDSKQVGKIAIPLPQLIKDVQQSALGDTLYWTSMLQLSRNDLGAAIASLRNYRIQYPEGTAVFPSLMNEAAALVPLNNIEAAIEVLRLADVEQNPEQLRAHWWLERLQAATPGNPGE